MNEKNNVTLEPNTSLDGQDACNHGSEWPRTRGSRMVVVLDSSMKV